jgi:hypothetical protein
MFNRRQISLGHRSLRHVHFIISPGRRSFVQVAGPGTTAAPRLSPPECFLGPKLSMNSTGDGSRSPWGEITQLLVYIRYCKVSILIAKLIPIVFKGLGGIG